MEERRAGREARGLVIFGRGPVPTWVHPLFSVQAAKQGGGQHPASPAGRDARSAPADAMADPRPDADPAEPAVPTLSTGDEDA